MNNQKGFSGITLILTLILFGFIFLGYVLYDRHQTKQQAEQQAQIQKQVQVLDETAKNKVVDDTLTQYDIAKKQGDAMQICVQAGMVSAAYLQAHNDTEYSKWKDIEKQDCAAAGIER